MLKPTIPEVLPRFQAYLEKNPVWGSLHIVLEDGNLADHNVQWCINHAREIGDTEGEALAEILLRMGYTQRRKLPHLTHYS